MALQKTVNKYQTLGIPGEFADDSPHRCAPYNVVPNPVEGVAAEGVLTFTANPSANDTITIANVTYTFKSTLAAANDVKIGTNLAATITSLAKVVNGTATAGTDCYTGTANLASLVSAEASATALNLTAVATGVAGNYINLASSDANVTPTAFSGGVDAAAGVPTIGCAFTQGSADNEAKLGGTGDFLGILVEPKQYANYNGDLSASLGVKSGAIGEICSMGHIFVKCATSFAPGYVAAFNQTTGAIYAYSAAGSIPGSGYTQIPGKFIKVSGGANTVGILEVGSFKV